MHMAETLSTTLNRSWLLKTGGFMLLLFVFGFWGLYDGVYLYPKRGLEDASYQFRDFLAAADKAGRLTTSNITVADPKGALRELRPKAKQLQAQASSSTPEARQAAMDAMKYMWLDSLAKVWRLSPGEKFLGTNEKAGKSLYFEPGTGKGHSVAVAGGERTELSPQQLLNELTTFWGGQNKPSPLSAFDMIFQWIFVAVGFIGGPWILLTILRSKAKARQITFEPGQQRLGLPGGVSITPTDIKDIDKRKWHKFYCTVQTTDGKAHELDLLRYTPLEDWVLAMEKTRFPERAEPEPKPEPGEPAPEESKSA
jgi:hypothetical protein